MTDRLEIWTLGGLTIKRGETSLDGLVPHKAAALLVYLACSGRPQPRQVLANLLIPYWCNTSQLAAE
jgi:DNA-binding SARP family transcriptional activator